MFVQIALDQFLLCLFHKELKSGRDVSLSAARFGRWVSFLAGLVGSYLVGLFLTCPGCVIWDGNTVPTNLAQDSRQ